MMTYEEYTSLSPEDQLRAALNEMRAVAALTEGANGGKESFVETAEKASRVRYYMLASGAMGVARVSSSGRILSIGSKDRKSLRSVFKRRRDVRASG